MQLIIYLVILKIVENLTHECKTQSSESTVVEICQRKEN